VKLASGLLSGFLGGLATLAVFWVAADYVWKSTDAASMCGPTVGFLIVICMFAASFPASIAVAIMAYRSSRQYVEAKDTQAVAKK
jgi:hypothetical protein